MRRRLLVITLAVLALLAGAFIWALPELVRRAALDQIPRRTGRAAAIEDVDLNLFTGRLAVKKFRLDEPDGAGVFFAADRLEARLSLLALLRREIRLVEAVVATPSVRVVRLGPGEFNSDLAAGSATSTQDAATDAPSRWSLTIDRFTLSGGTVRVLDRAVEPAAEWLVQDLSLDLAGLTTRAGAAPGRSARERSRPRGTRRRSRSPPHRRLRQHPRQAPRRARGTARRHPDRGHRARGVRGGGRRGVTGPGRRGSRD